MPLAQERDRGRAGAWRRWPARIVAAGSVPFFLGAGAYKRHVPASVDHLIQRSEFLTSYTPYQPEIAQGTLQVLFEFQTQVAALTGMEVANASMYDGSTACARGDADGASPHPPAKGRAVGRTASAICRCLRDARAYGRRPDRPRCRPMSPASEDIARAIDDETSCVDRADARLLRQSARSSADRRRRARARRAFDRRVHRSGGARRGALAGRNGRRHRSRRRAGRSATR